MRIEANVSRAALARCARIDAAHLWRIENGTVNATVDVLVAIGACLGCDLGVRLFPTAGPRLHDRFQAPMVEALIRATGPGWRAEPEVPVPAARGVIDLVLRRPADRLIVVCECHSELRRLELAIRRLGEKAEAIQALELGATVSRLLVVRSTSATREVARAFEGTLSAALPGSPRMAVAALQGAGAWPGPTLLWLRVEGGRATVMARTPRGIRAAARAATLAA
jgi:transcriptional regulator with XRE-family HTH domain